MGELAFPSFCDLLFEELDFGVVAKLGVEVVADDKDGEAVVVVVVVVTDAATSWVQSLNQGPSVNPIATARSSEDRVLNHCRTICSCVGEASFFGLRTVEPIVVASAPSAGDGLFKMSVVEDMLVSSLVTSVAIVILLSFQKCCSDTTVMG